jgi:hypothetical protein
MGFPDGSGSFCHLFSAKARIIRNILLFTLSLKMVAQKKYIFSAPLNKKYCNKVGQKKSASYLHRTAQPHTLAIFRSWGSSVGAGRIRLAGCKYKERMIN